MEKKFKTQTGYCHICPDKIILTNYGSAREVIRLRFFNGYRFIDRQPLLFLITTSILGIYYSAPTAKWIAITFFSSAAALFTYRFIIGFTWQGTPVIERQTIRQLRLIEGRFFIVAPRLEITNEKLQKRRIVLPGILRGGKNETEKAIALLQSENLLTP
jgi:hypothetical protein